MATTASERTGSRSPEDRRRRLAAIAIAAICVIALIAGGVLVYRAVASTDPKSDTALVEEQATGYLDDMATADLTGAAARMCQALGSVVSGRGEVPELPTDAPAAGRGESVVDSVSISGDTAKVDASLRYPTTTIPLPMTLRRESDGWCITDVG